MEEKGLQGDHNGACGCRTKKNSKGGGQNTQDMMRKRVDWKFKRKRQRSEARCTTVEKVRGNFRICSQSHRELIVIPNFP